MNRMAETFHVSALIMKTATRLQVVLVCCDPNGNGSWVCVCVWKGGGHASIGGDLFVLFVHLVCARARARVCVCVCVCVFVCFAVFLHIHSCLRETRRHGSK